MNLLKKLPTFKSCLCCISLELGSRIVGFISLIFGVVVAIGYFSAVINIGSINARTKAEQDAKRTAIAILSILALFGLVQITLSIVLLYGVFKKRPGVLNFWIVSQILLIILHVLSFIKGLITFNHFYDVVPDVVFLCYTVYFVAIINSFYQGLDAISNGVV